MANKKSKDSSDAISDSKLYAFLSILLTIIGYVLVHFARKDDKYAMHYAKQGLVLFIAGAIAAVAAWILDLIPVIGGLMSTILWVVLLVLWIIGMLYALSGEKKDIPVIGDFAKKL